MNVPLSLLKQLYNLACEAEFDGASGLCTHCGAAVSPVFNQPHDDHCEWQNTITAIEAILGKEPIQQKQPNKQWFETDIEIIRGAVLTTVQEAINYPDALESLTLDTTFESLEFDSLDTVENVMRLETIFKTEYDEHESKRLAQATTQRELAAELLLIHSERNN